MDPIFGSSHKMNCSMKGSDQPSSTKETGSTSVRRDAKQTWQLRPPAQLSANRAEKSNSGSERRSSYLLTPRGSSSTQGNIGTTEGSSWSDTVAKMMAAGALRRDSNSQGTPTMASVVAAAMAAQKTPLTGAGAVGVQRRADSLDAFMSTAATPRHEKAPLSSPKTVITSDCSEVFQSARRSLNHVVFDVSQWA